jgi:hypothetical protein
MPSKTWTPALECRGINSVDMTASEQKRVTIRLNHDQIAGIQQVCCETGSDTSMVVRSALQDFFNRRNGPHRSGESASTTVQRQVAVHTPPPASGDHCGLTEVQTVHAESPKAATSPLAKSCQTAPVKAAAPQFVRTAPELSLPPSIAALVPQSLGLGADLQKVRRLQFQRVVAATFIATENLQGGREAQPYAELTRIGGMFGLLI